MLKNKISKTDSEIKDENNPANKVKEKFLLFIKLFVATLFLLNLTFLTYLLINKIQIREFNLSFLKSNTYTFFMQTILIFSIYLFLISFIYHFKKVKNLIFIILIAITMSFLSSLIIQYLQCELDINTMINWIFNKYKIFLLNTSIIFSIYMLLISLTSLYWGVILGFIFFGILGIVNLLKINFLEQPLYPVDFYQIRNIDSFVSFLGINVFVLILTVLFSIAIIIYLGTKFKKYNLDNVYKFVTILFCLGIIGNSITPIDVRISSSEIFAKNLYKNLYAKVGARYVAWDQLSNYKLNGLIYSLLSNINVKTTQSNDYLTYSEDSNKEIINKIIEKYKLKAKIYNSEINDNSVKPNIIYIMSESFFDPTRLDFINFSDDPIKNIRKGMDKNFLSGYNFSPQFGGLTCNVEFEALTGFSMSNLKDGSNPYEQSIKESYPSIISLLKKEGYKTYGVHPYIKTFFKRNSVYKNFGIHEFISQDEMTYTEKLTDGAYISDIAMVKEIKKILEENNEPIFVNGVSMQNHGPFNKGRNGKESIDVNWDKSTDSTKNMLTTYVEGIKQSDLAIKDLLDYVKNFHKPTMVVFFGDHLPYFIKNSDIIENDFFNNMNSESKEKILSETPLFYYANFDIDIDDKEINTLGTNYISLTTFELLNKKISPFYAMLNCLRDEFKGIKGSIFLDSTSNVHDNITYNLSTNQKNILNEYKLIQEDIMEGNRYSLKEFFSVED